MPGLCGLLPTGIGILVSFIRPGQTLENLNSYSIIAGALDGSFTAIFFWLFAVYIPSHRAKGC
jgi:hypothetical protein